MNIRLMGSKEEIEAYVRILKSELNLDCKVYANQRGNEYRTYFEINSHIALEAIKKIKDKK